MRATRYTPAATIVAAWISAETGVGPSIASGSQTCSGNCADLPTAPANSPSANSVSAAELIVPAIAAWWITGMFSVSVCVQIEQQRDHEPDVADPRHQERLRRRLAAPSP